MTMSTQTPIGSQSSRLVDQVSELQTEIKHLPLDELLRKIDEQLTHEDMIGEDVYVSPLNALAGATPRSFFDSLDNIRNRRNPAGDQ